MPLKRIRKSKKLGTTDWIYDKSVDVHLKRIFIVEDRSKDWPLKNHEEIIYRISEISHEEFYARLVRTIGKIQSRNLRFKLIWALKRYSEDEKKLFVLYIHHKDITDEEVDLFHSKKLVLAYFSDYYIITRNSISEVNFLCLAIEFFERFDHLVLSDKEIPFLMFGFRDYKEGIITLLFYCDISGQGMLIKSKSSDSKISPELEIEILRLGSIIEVDVPKRAAVLRLDPEDEIINVFASINNNILIQRLIPSAFPLYAASEEDIENVIKHNSVNLGRMLCFDVLAGSWDRHSGNYVIHPKDINPIKIEYSLSEIDFGLFNPEWYPPSDFLEINYEEFDDNNPPVISKRDGWALTRHPIVSDMIKRSDQKKVIRGIEGAFKNLKKFLKEESNPEKIFSLPLLKRIKNIFLNNSKVRLLLEAELEKLDISIDFSKEIFKLDPNELLD